RRHTRCLSDWSSDVCSSDLNAIQILAARKPAVVNPEALVFATRDGRPFDRHNLSRRQLNSTCKKLGLVGAGWHWLRHANATLLEIGRASCRERVYISVGAGC